MKKLFYFVLILFVFSFVSCRFFTDVFIDDKIVELNNYIEESTPSQKKNISFSLSGKLDYSGALPSGLLSFDTLAESSVARTAMPDSPAYIYKYKIDESSLETLEVDNTGVFILQTSVASSQFTFTIQAFTSAASTDPFLTASKVINLNPLNPNLNESFTLEPVGTGYGTVSLAVYTSDTTISECIAEWTDSSGTAKSQTLTFTSANGRTDYFTMDDATDITPGVYSVTFAFYNSQSGLKYKCTELVNVFASLTTDKWINTGSLHINTTNNGGKGALVVDDTVISLYGKHNFYVSDVPTANGTGTFFDPVTIDRALSIINSIKDDQEYTIYLLADIVAAADDSDWPSGQDSFITLNSNNTFKLKICSYGNPATPYKLDANRSVSHPGRVININSEDVTLTLENIIITGGYSSKDGAGVYNKQGKLILGNNGIVKNNYFSTANLCGAGIYNYNGTITLNTGSSVTGNGSIFNLPDAGGGIYCFNGYIFMEADSSVTGNTAVSGAGAYITHYFDDTSYINGIFSNNQATGGLGGALYVIAENGFSINGGQFKSNSSTVKGGAIYCSVDSCKQSGQITISGATLFENNTTDGFGGAVAMDGGTVVLQGTTSFEGNTAAIGKGNAIYISGDTTGNPKLTLSEAFDFSDSPVQYTCISYNKTKDRPYITVGDFSGGASQKLNLFFPASALPDIGSTILVGADASVDLSTYPALTEIYTLNAAGTALVAADYTVSSTGKYKSKQGLPADPSLLVDGVNYPISEQTDLETLRTWVNTGNDLEGKSFVLANPITITGNWEPIGTYVYQNSKVFSGTFDGNGNSITYSLDSESTTQRSGFFGNVKNATIKNLTLNGTMNVKGYAGAFTGRVEEGGTCVIDNCINNVNITSDNSVDTGGFIGTGVGTSITIRNSVNAGSIVSSAGYVGGFIGKTTTGNTELTIINCVNYGKVSGSSYFGSIVGESNSNKVNINNIVTLGDLLQDKTSAGDIVGTQKNSITSLKLEHCYHLYFYDYVVSNYEVLSNNASYQFNDNYELLTKANKCVYRKSGNIYDVVDSLNSWIENDASDPTYATYKKWVYNTDNYPDFVASKSYTITPVFGEIAECPAQIEDSETVPTSGSFEVNSLSDIDKIADWVKASSDGLENVKFTLEDDFTIAAGLWTSIGTSTKPFKGTFDGNGYTIEGVQIQGGAGKSNALFGYVEGGNIKNITITGAISNATDYVGGIVGKASGVTLIENCIVDMSINSSSSDYVGGVVGYIDAAADQDVVIRNCRVNLGVAGQNYVGGIVGYISENAKSVSIINCGVALQVQGTDYVGGILGYSENKKTVITNCFVQGTVTTGTDNGAIAGYVTDTGSESEIRYCYAIRNHGGSVSLFGNTVGDKDITERTTTCSPIEFYLATGETDKICIYAADETSDLVDDYLNDWCSNNSTPEVTYTQWDYVGADGKIIFDYE